MSLFKKIRLRAISEFTDIIEWTEESANTIVYRYNNKKAKIKNGAQLTVRKEQVAVLVSNNQFADVYQPGHYELNVNNMPILAKIKRWKQGFKSPFKIDIYFVNTQQFLDLQWSTTIPVVMLDTEFGPIRISAHGLYSFKVGHDPIVFIRNVAGTEGDFTSESIYEQLSNFVVAKFIDYLKKSKIAALDLAENLNAFSNELLIALKEDFSNYGIELTDILVEKISLPIVVKDELNKRTSNEVFGEMTTYTQMKLSESFKNTINNSKSSDN